MIGRVREEDAGAIAVYRDGAQSRGEVALRSRAAIGNTDDLEPVDVDAFIVQDTNSRGRDRIEILRVVTELFVISGHEVDSMRSGELAEGLGGLGCVDRGAVEKISGDEDEVGFLTQNFRDQAAEETAIAHVTEVNVCEECSFASAPDVRHVFEADPDAGDPGQAGIEESEKPDDDGGTKQCLDESMKVERGACDSGDRQGYPGENRGEEQETEEAHPDGGSFVEGADRSVRVGKRQQRCGDETDGENTENCPEPKALRGVGDVRVEPGLIEKKMRE